MRLWCESIVNVICSTTKHHITSNSNSHTTQQSSVFYVFHEKFRCGRHYRFVSTTHSFTHLSNGNVCLCFVWCTAARRIQIEQNKWQRERERRWNYDDDNNYYGCTVLMVIGLLNKTICSTMGTHTAPHTHIDRYGTPLFSVIFMVVSSHRRIVSHRRLYLILWTFCQQFFVCFVPSKIPSIHSNEQKHITNSSKATQNKWKHHQILMQNSIPGQRRLLYEHIAMEIKIE